MHPEAAAPQPEEGQLNLHLAEDGEPENAPSATRAFSHSGVPASTGLVVRYSVEQDGSAENDRQALVRPWLTRQEVTMPPCPQCRFPMDPDEVACGRCGHRPGGGGTYRSDCSREDLLALGLTADFVGFVFLEPKPRPFASWCEPRGSGWPCALPEDADAVFPLWSCNGDVTAAVVRGGRAAFVKLRHDDPTPEPLARSEQGLLARLFVGLIESPRATPRGLRQAAQAAGFRHLDELVAWHERGGGEDFEEQLDQFVRALDERAG
jgi:hypothetical protein